MANSPSVGRGTVADALESGLVIGIFGKMYEINRSVNSRKFWPSKPVTLSLDLFRPANSATKPARRSSKAWPGEADDTSRSRDGNAARCPAYRSINALSEYSATPPPQARTILSTPRPSACQKG
jgi:hypothetical protein